MANTLRIKRRVSGAPGAPATLANAELAFNEVDNTLYYGKGDSGGNATSILAVGGDGAMVTLSGNQTITGNKTFSGTTTAPTVALGDNSTNVATTAYVKGQAYVTAADTVASANVLTTARDISISGDATWTVNFNGSANVSSALTLANSGVGAGTYTKVTVDAKGRVTVGATLADTDIPSLLSSKISNFDTSVRTSRLDQMTAPSASVSFNGQRITNLAEPTALTDAATKNYVDLTVQGLDPKQSVRAATTANIALSGNIVVDGVSLVDGDRVLVKDQTTTTENGIYVVAAGAWSRSADADTWAELPSAYLFVEEGSTNADMGFLCTSDAGGTLGVTPITFVQFNGAGQVLAGNGLSKTGNTLALAGQAAALHDLAVNGIVARTGAGTVAARSVAASGSGISVADGDGVAGNPTVSLSDPLSSVGGLTAAADQIAYYTGASTAAVTTLSAYGRTLIDDADATTARATLGLGSMATQAASAVAITGGTIDNVIFDGGTF